MRLKVQLRAVLAASVLVAGCTGTTDSDSATPAAQAGGACLPYAAYQGASGTAVTILGPARPDATEDADLRSWSEFESCTGIRVVPEYSPDGRALEARMSGGNAPDLAFAGMGFLPTAVNMTGAGVSHPVPAPAAVVANVERWWNPAWKTYGSVDGVLYGAPTSADVKSLVWYSPKLFAAAGYEVPTTWEGLMSLSATIASTGDRPWCGGIEAGDDTGWPATDWLEEIVLGEFGGEVYDDWIAHKVTFDSPQIRQAMGTLDSWMRNPDWVNAGIGNVRSIATTWFVDAGQPILDGRCFMLQQASFYESQWSDMQEDVDVGPDGDVYAFYLPAPESKPLRIVGSGGVVLAFSDRLEVQYFQTYLSSPEWNTRRVQEGGDFVSANRGVPLDAYLDPIYRLSAALLAKPGVVFRVDASDLMPAEVGLGAEWKQLTLWFSEGKETEAVLRAIDRAWPEPS